MIVKPPLFNLNSDSYEIKNIPTYLIEAYWDYIFSFKPYPTLELLLLEGESK